MFTLFQDPDRVHALAESVTMQSMSELTADTTRMPVPRATHEFRLEEAVRAKGHAFVRYRDGERFRAVALLPASSMVYIGRDAGCVVGIENDVRVSRRHARLIFGASQWSIEDGPSRNGTYVDGKRTVGEHILADRALISVGRTVLSFHDPPTTTIVTTLSEDPPIQRLSPTATQRRVLVELARPFMARNAGIPVTPTNAAIAATLGYQVTTIRDAISDLYRQAGLLRGASQQRSELVRIAIIEGTVEPQDFA
jgi:hypothetical protein